jgi:hypothetical protein
MRWWMNSDYRHDDIKVNERVRKSTDLYFNKESKESVVSWLFRKYRRARRKFLWDHPWFTWNIYYKLRSLGVNI